MLNSISRKIFLLLCSILFFVLCISLTSCTPVDSSEIMNALLPNVYVFIAHIFASIVLLTMTIWLVWKPTKNTLEKRRNYIANEIKQAEDVRKEAYLRLQEAEQTKIDAHNRASLIISDASNKAYHRKEEIELEANFNAKKIRNDAEIEIEKLKTKMQSEMQKQIVDIAFSAAETLIKKKYSEKDDYKTIDAFVKQLNEKDKHE